jgi:argininosuccinate lyase
MTDEPRLWGGRFSGAPDSAFAEFNRSFGFDRRLFAADVRGSLAHSNALARAGVLTSQEAEQVNDALRALLQRAHREPEFFATSSEDVHSFVEARLTEVIGDLARKLHTGRSRNDQVATDLRLWTRDAIDEISNNLRAAQEALLHVANENSEAVMPGYTHLQRAQPILFAHWCLAYFEMLSRDRERLSDVRKRMNILPLGSAALAGTSYAIDREAVARELGFAGVSNNSLDAVSDRDFCIEFVSACALIMLHLSRLAEDIILYTTTEFGFLELSDAVSTGSSLMPQKKNPDSMELVRGKSGRLFGHLTSLLAMMKGLPLAYNKDMQEDKEAVFDSSDTVIACLTTTVTVLVNLTVNEERMRAGATTGYLNATELADYLVRKGMPFREAHETVGRVVLHALSRSLEVQELPLSELQHFSSLITDDVADALSLERTLAVKNVIGGTSPERVREALAQAKRKL